LIKQLGGGWIVYTIYLPLFAIETGLKRPISDLEQTFASRKLKGLNAFLDLATQAPAKNVFWYNNGISGKYSNFCLGSAITLSNVDIALLFILRM